MPVPGNVILGCGREANKVFAKTELLHRSMRGGEYQSLGNLLKLSDDFL